MPPIAPAPSVKSSSDPSRLGKEKSGSMSSSSSTDLLGRGGNDAESSKQIADRSNGNGNSSSVFKPPSPLILALSGFNKADGEHDSMLSTLKTIRDSMTPQHLPSNNTKRTTSQRGTHYSTTSHVVQIIEDDEDAAADFTYLIVPRNSTV